MHRIDGPGATVDNKFTDGDPVGGIQATVVTDDWLNDIQEELMSILVAAGVTPVKGTQNQVLKSLILSKSIRRFTASGSFTVPAGVTQIWVSGCAGGGGGGSSLATNTSSFVTGGSGGGAGQPILRVPVSVTPGAVIPVTIGTGGTGATAALNNATAGGNTQLGTAGALVNLGGGSPGSVGGGGTTVPGDYGGPGGGIGFPQGERERHQCLRWGDRIWWRRRNWRGISIWGCWSPRQRFHEWQRGRTSRFRVWCRW